jgi:hypothetical protein
METKSLDLGGEGGDSRLDAMRWWGNSVGFAVGGVVAKNVEYNGVGSIGFPTMAHTLAPCFVSRGGAEGPTGTLPGEPRCRRYVPPRRLLADAWRHTHLSAFIRGRGRVVPMDPVEIFSRGRRGSVNPLIFQALETHPSTILWLKNGLSQGAIHGIAKGQTWRRFSKQPPKKWTAGQATSTTVSASSRMPSPSASAAPVARRRATINGTVQGLAQIPFPHCRLASPRPSLLPLPPWRASCPEMEPPQRQHVMASHTMPGAADFPAGYHPAWRRSAPPRPRCSGFP